MLQKIHHLGYWVGDLEAAIARQELLFGFEVTQRLISPISGGPVVFLRSGDSMIELMERPGQEPPGEIVFDHVAYAVEDLDGLVAHLRAQGVEFEQDAPVPNAGRRAIWTRRATTAGVRLQLSGD